MSSFSRRVAQQKKKQQQQPAEQTSPALQPSATEEQPRMSQSEEYYGDDQAVAEERPKWERTIPPRRIRPNPFQARQIFDEEKLQELAAGMAEHGWVGGGLPVRPHPTEANTYELVWGERRWRAAQMAQLESIPCVISNYSDEDLIELGLLENIQRENLTNLEEGQAYVKLLTIQNTDGKPRYSIRRLAQRIGKDKSYIEDRLVLARVPLDVQQLAADQPDVSPRILRELDAISKLLEPEERKPVLDGVRKGYLRIEDVREIRKDIEHLSSSKEELSVATDSSEHTTSYDLPSHSKVSVATDTLGLKGSIQTDAEEKLSVATDSREQALPSAVLAEEKLSVATDSREQALPSAVLAEEKLSVATDSSGRNISTPTPPAGRKVSVATDTLVLAKTLDRDTTALQRILQRLHGDCETMTEEQRMLVKQRLGEWRDALDQLLSDLGA